MKTRTKNLNKKVLGCAIALVMTGSCFSGLMASSMNAFAYSDGNGKYYTDFATYEEVEE